MKRLSLKYIIVLLFAGYLFSTCNKSFLDVDAKGISLESNYYSTPA